MWRAVSNWGLCQRMIIDASGVIDVVADPGLGAAANRPGHPLQPADLAAALQDAQALEIVIEATPWPDVRTV